MNFFVKTIGFFCYLPYALAKRYEQYKIEKFYKNFCIFSPSSKFGQLARIQNYQNDKSRIVIGDETALWGHLMIYKHGGEIRIGDHCFIGENTRIWSAKKIVIGDRVLISHNVNIHDQISHPLNSKERHEDYKRILKYGLQDNVNLREKAITIEDDVWIGFNVTIMKGVTIGKGAIIGANCLITQDVPPFSVIVGNPPRIIKQTT